MQDKRFENVLWSWLGSEEGAHIRCIGRPGCQVGQLGWPRDTRNPPPHQPPSLASFFLPFLEKSPESLLSTGEGPCPQKWSLLKHFSGGDVDKEGSGRRSGKDNGQQAMIGGFEIRICAPRLSTGARPHTSQQSSISEGVLFEPVHI